jgi:putative transposase
MVSLTRFKNFRLMHDRKLIRLPGFDYSSGRYYFITICVNDHINSFGFIRNKIMHLSENGIIAQDQWNWLGKQYPYLELVTFIVMPDHIHGVLYIDEGYYKKNPGRNCRDRSLQEENSKIKPLPELIGAYKTTVSKRIHLAGDILFRWQKSYHDHIIRNNNALERIIEYIETNPANWSV